MTADAPRDDDHELETASLPPMSEIYMGFVRTTTSPCRDELG